jgi:spore germination protein BC
VRRACVLPLALGLVFVLTGCWDIVSPEQLVIPTILAVDWQGGRYHVTIQSVAPALLSVGPGGGGGGGGSTTSPVRVRSGSGPTLLTAIRRAGFSFPDPTSLSQLQVLVLGRSVLAPRPFAGVLDTLIRSPFLDRNFWVFGTEGPADQVLKGANPTGLHPADVLVRTSEREAASARIRRHRFGPWTEALVSGPTTVPLPLVEVEAAERPGTGQDFRFPGSLLVQGGRVVGRVSPDETAVWTVLAPAGGEDSPVLPVFTFVEAGTRYAFSLTRYRTRIELTPAALRLDTSVAARLEEMDRPDGGPVRKPPVPESELAQALARHITAQALGLLDRTQRRGLDILAIDRIAAARMPAWYQAHRADWPRTLAKLPTTVRVKASIESTGDLSS